MATSLYKLSDLARRWVKKMVWVREGYWQPDPLPPPPIVPPSDPIGQDLPILQGFYTEIKIWPELPTAYKYGTIPTGYVRVTGYYRYGPIPPKTYYEYAYFSWYEPA